jgi:uncharacterized Zn finger protein (UPF0148 family)
MKCVCGFEGDITQNGKEFVDNRNKFVMLDIPFYSEALYIGDKYFSYVCPKCGTFKIDLDKKGEIV